MRFVSRAFLVLLLSVVGIVGCYEDPQQQMDEMQAMTDMVDAMNELTARTSELTFTLDSLRLVIARQDTAITRLANLAGMPYNR